MAIALASRYPDVTFCLVGPDEGEAGKVTRLVQEADLEQRILLQPPVSPNDVRRRMSQALVYVLPARNEPFGLTVLEALSVGVPVVLSKSGGLAQVVEDAGAGITTADSVESLADAVAQLLDSDQLRTEMGERGRQLVRDRYSIDQVRDALRKVYFSSAKDHRHREHTA